MSIGWVPRLGALVAVGLTALVAMAVPAFAHGRGSESTNFESRVLKAPELQGVTWDVYGGDQFLAVTNTTDTELLVTGYQGEPYLRVGPDGVFHNVASEAAYVNADRYGEVASLPPDVGPEQEPRWEKLSDEPSHAWHDHRIHWMSPQLPPAVVDQGKETLINPWEVGFAYGDQELKVTGELRWLPPPSPLPWIGAGLALTGVAALGLRRHSETNGASGHAHAGGGWLRPLVSPAAAVLLVVSLANITHLVDDFLAVPAPLATQLTSAVQTALFIALGIFGAVVARRGRDGAFTALGVGSGGIFVGQGVLYLDALTKAHSASVFPDWLTRLIIGASLAQVLWVGAVAVLGNRRMAAEDRDATSGPTEVPAT